jgi:hypothetical protein
MTLLSRGLTAALPAALALLAACADASEPSGGGDPGAAPPAEAGIAEDLVASCGQVQFDSVPADPSSLPPLGEPAQSELDLEGLGVEADFFDVHDWSVVAETGDTLRLLGVPHTPADESYYGYATFAREGERWVPENWGGCRITLAAPGWGNAHFVLDPDSAPDPAAASIAVRAWEVECASGQTPEGREVRPVVLSEDGDTVSIVILVEPVTGGANCQSNPSFPLEIALDEPLGDRAVHDASVDPPLPRPWPPSESSLSSEGREG